MTLCWNPAVGIAPSDRPDAAGRLHYWIQRRDRPIAHRWLEHPLERRLIELAHANARRPADGLETSELERAIEMGVVLEDGLLPIEPPEFRVPLRGASQLADASRCRINRELVWQVDEEPPFGHAFAPHPKSHGGAFSRERPILWVKQPSGVHSPVWIGEDEAILRRILATGELVPELNADLIRHGILERPERFGDRLERWRTSYARDRWVVIEGVHPEPLLAAFRSYSRALKAAGLYRMDVMTVKEKREGMYQEVVSRLIHRLLTPAIGAVLDRAIKASYCWFRRYLPGAILERHSDRPQCRWNVSMCIDSEPEHAAVEWPIHLEVGGEVRTVPLAIGQMVLYAGTELPHWRDELPPERSVTNFFFHFVEESFEGSLD